MGTKVHCKSYQPGYLSMRDLNEGSSSSNWPLFYGDKTLPNGQYYNSFLTRNVINPYRECDKDGLKQTMLEHEAVFKHQVFELHRLYTRQRDMMDEIKRKELHKHRIPMETSSSSSPLVSQTRSQDAWNWHKPNFPLLNSGSSRPSVSVAENVSSPLSCTNGNIKLASSKGCEILEFRPSKVRKKLFDLQLPADEYIDTEEEGNYPGNKISDVSRYPHSRNHKLPSESSVKLNCGSVVKIDCDGDASRFGSCSRNSVGLADLNEPILVEEVTLPTSVDLKGMDLGVKPKSQFLLGLPKESLENSQHGSNNGSSVDLQVENKRIGRECSSYMFEAGHNKPYLSSFLQPDKQLMSSHPTHTTLNKVLQPLGMLPSDHSKVDLRRERTFHGDLSERSRDLSSSNHLGPVLASHLPSPYPLVHASDLDNGCSHSISTWGKPNCSLTPNMTSSSQMPPCLDSLGTLSRSSQASLTQASAQSHENFLNPGYGNGLPNCNGFYHGSSSGSKDIPNCFSSAGFDYLNCNKSHKVPSERSITYGAKSYLKGSNVNMKATDLNLNADFSMDEDMNCEGHKEVMHWLKAKPANKNEGTGSRRDSNTSELSFLRDDSNHLSNRTETVKGVDRFFTKKVTLPSCDREVGAKRNEFGHCRVNGKIFGFPIFDNPNNESSSIISTSASLRCPPQHEDLKVECKNRLIDINLACDPETGTQIAAEVLVVEKGRDKKVANFRTHIDLNSCASEDEVTLMPSFASSTSVSMKIAVEINLEAPPVPEAEEYILPVEDQQQNDKSLRSPQREVEQPLDEAVRIAAGAIVAISSSGHLDRVELESATCHPSEAPAADSLQWFVEVVSSYVDDIDIESRGKDGGDNELSLSDEIDYFEAMTLNLKEIKEEEYMPKPLVMESPKVEENGNVSLPNRPRRGQARRGRQRRDFQRDILPGLVSLSRHEVSEDLQTFGGLMRAMGHTWNLGSTRRNGGAARGRRRRLVFDTAPAVTEITVCTPLMQQLNSFEVGLVDQSLTGWGKTPRRPRRQRCPAGNPPPMALA